MSSIFVILLIGSILGKQDFVWDKSMFPSSSQAKRFNRNSVSRASSRNNTASQKLSVFGSETMQNAPIFLLLIKICLQSPSNLIRLMILLLQFETISALRFGKLLIHGLTKLMATGGK